MSMINAGFGKCDITPAVGVRLDGFGARSGPSTGVGSRLFASVVVIEGEQGRTVIAGVDILGVKPDVAEEMAREIGAAAGCPADRVVVAHSHTHSGPMTLPVREGLLAATKEAVESLKPVRVGWGRAPVELGVNRRVKQVVDGRRSVAMLPNLDGPRDKEVTALFLWGDEAQRPMVVYCHACHPYCVGPDGQICADFCGYSRMSLEEAGFDPVFINGCAGDIMPVKSQLGTSAAREEGERLAAAVRAAWKVREEEPGATAACESVHVNLPHAPMPGLPELTAQVTEHLRAVDADGRLDPGFVRRVRMAMVEWLAEMETALGGRGRLPDQKGRVSVVRVGQGAVVALPGEVFFETGQAAAARLGAKHAAISCFCHGYTGYAPTGDAQRWGGYEADSAHKYTSLWCLHEKAPGLLVQAAASAWEKVK